MHHGGAGTTVAAARAGRPQVVGDQIIGDQSVRRHALKGRGLDDPVPQLHGTEPGGREYVGDRSVHPAEYSMFSSHGSTSPSRTASRLAYLARSAGSFSLVSFRGFRTR